MVVPNGTLFGDGVCARIKHELLTEFNLHTIVRLPNGVFAPYTSIPTNLLFFDRSGPTEDDLVLRAAAARGAKELHEDQAHPVRGVRRLPEMVGQAEGERPGMESARASRLSTMAATSTSRIRTPRTTSSTFPPEQLAEDILQKEHRIAEIMREIKELLGRKP